MCSQWVEPRNEAVCDGHLDPQRRRQRLSLQSRQSRQQGYDMRSSWQKPLKNAKLRQLQVRVLWSSVLGIMGSTLCILTSSSHIFPAGNSALPWTMSFVTRATVVDPSIGIAPDQNKQQVML